MKLVHYASAPVEHVVSVTQHQRGFKPAGFWVSVDDDWRSWCVGESFGLDRLTHVHDVILAPAARILQLSNSTEIDAFTAKYVNDRRGMEVDWPRVAEQHQGIVITPYCWQRRLHGQTFWYYGWDCASGCLWDAAAIASVTLRQIVPEPHE